MQNMEDIESAVMTSYIYRLPLKIWIFQFFFMVSSSSPRM